MLKWRPCHGTRPGSVPVQVDVDLWIAALGCLCAAGAAYLVVKEGPGRAAAGFDGGGRSGPVCRNQGGASGCVRAVRGRLAETRLPTRCDCAPGGST